MSPVSAQGAQKLQPSIYSMRKLAVVAEQTHVLVMDVLDGLTSSSTGEDNDDDEMSEAKEKEADDDEAHEAVPRLSLTSESDSPLLLQLNRAELRRIDVLMRREQEEELDVCGMLEKVD